jgi:hypothetical protein
MLFQSLRLEKDLRYLSSLSRIREEGEPFEEVWKEEETFQENTVYLIHIKIRSAESNPDVSVALPYVK